jgi:signal transduction histidine kinase
VTDTQPEEILELKKAVAELTILNKIACLVNSAMTMDDICATIVENAVKHLDASQGAIFILAEEGLSENIFKTFVRAADESSKAFPFHLNDFIKNWIIENKVTLIINGAESDKYPALAGIFREGIHSVLAIPLFGREGIIGIVAIFNKKTGDRFHPDDARFLSIIGAQSAKIIENMIQFRRFQEHRMKKISRIVAGFSHEINNPMAAVFGSADTLARSIKYLKEIMPGFVEESNPDFPNIRRSINALTQSLDIISSGRSRIDKILERLEDFINLDQAKYKIININESLDNCIKLLEYRIDPKRISIIKNIGAENIRVSCIPSQINQVFFDIIENAINSIKEMGQIEISAQCTNGFAKVVISDSGVGIDTDKLERLFESDFTAGIAGVGIGLPICSQILKNHGGDISISSRPNEGTTVTVNIPLAANEGGHSTVSDQNSD